MNDGSWRGCVRLRARGQGRVWSWLIDAGTRGSSVAAARWQRHGNAQACRELGGSGWVAWRRAVDAARPRWGRLPRARAAGLLGSGGVQRESREEERREIGGRESVVQQGGYGG
jgi:hypothetical protein